MLTGLTTSQVVAGTPTAAGLSVNRFGKGYVVYSSLLLADRLAAAPAPATAADLAARRLAANLVTALLDPAGSGLDQAVPTPPDPRVFRGGGTPRRAVVLAGQADLATAREFIRVVRAATGVAPFLNLPRQPDDLAVQL